MKQRNVIAKPAHANGTTVEKSNTSRAGSPRASSQLFSLVNLFIGVIFGFILFGIIFLHTRLDQLEAQHSKQMIRSSNSKGDHVIIARPVSNNEQVKVISNKHVEGRGAVKCNAEISSLVSYWDDPLSYADRTFRSPFLENPLTTTAEIGKLRR